MNKLVHVDYYNVVTFKLCCRFLNRVSLSLGLRLVIDCDWWQMYGQSDDQCFASGEILLHAVSLGIIYSWCSVNCGVGYRPATVWWMSSSQSFFLAVLSYSIPWSIIGEFSMQMFSPRPIRWRQSTAYCSSGLPGQSKVIHNLDNEQ